MERAPFDGEAAGVPGNAIIPFTGHVRKVSDRRKSGQCPLQASTVTLAVARLYSTFLKVCAGVFSLNLRPGRGSLRAACAYALVCS